MGETFLTAEPLPFDCPDCGHQWVTTYEKRHVTFDGREAVTWYRDGQPSTSPRAGQVCPACGGYRVRMRPLSLRQGRPRRLAVTDAGCD